MIYIMKKLAYIYKLSVLIVTFLILPHLLALADINKCRDGVADCDQRCVNLQGKYKCLCFEGYHLDENGRCKFSDTNSSKLVSLVFTDKHQIRRLELNSGRFGRFMPPLASGLAHTTGLDLDVRKRFLYWTDVHKETIDRVHFGYENDSTNKVEPILSKKDGVRSSFGIAVDWINEHIYWSDKSLKKIFVSYLNGSWPTTIVASPDAFPFAIALHPGKKFLFVIALRTEAAFIRRYGMNGRNKQDLITQDIAVPTGLVIDYEEDRLFWIDMKLHQIASSDFDGHQRVNVLNSSKYIKMPNGIALLYDKVYWMDRGLNKLLFCNKWNGMDVHVIDAKLEAPFSLKIDHLFTQPQYPSSCSAHHCQFICLPSLTTSLNYTCSCPNGYIEINDDSSQCVQVFADPSHHRNQDKNRLEPQLEITVVSNGKISTNGTFIDDEFLRAISNTSKNNRHRAVVITCISLGAAFIFIFSILVICRLRRNRCLKLKVRATGSTYRKGNITPVKQFELSKANSKANGYGIEREISDLTDVETPTSSVGSICNQVSTASSLNRLELVISDKQQLITSV